uniref:Ig-like domain-containing protein n=1 Tax=Anabas testudineus TaxID=64144 RepID=A0AAQ6IQM8_ANATE
MKHTRWGNTFYRYCIFSNMFFVWQTEPLATVGESAVLPCYLETPVDATDMIVDWRRPDLSPGFIHMWRNNKEILKDFKQPSYTGRTSLLINKLKHGDVSLKLSRVRLSDEGTYRCFIPALGEESFVELIVGSVSTPSIEVISNTSGRLVLQCESKGWYPEPELLWLDAEGKILSAGPTETVRGPDDLYTVSSRVTVEKRHSNNIICRVQQRNINQTRETQIVVKCKNNKYKVLFHLRSRLYYSSHHRCCLHWMYFDFHMVKLIRSSKLQFKYSHPDIILINLGIYFPLHCPRPSCSLHHTAVLMVSCRYTVL